MSGGNDSFLGRWSRRKHAADRVAVPVLPAPEPSAEPEQVPDPVCLTDDGLAALPRVEDLAEGSDIAGFLRPGVPRALKNAALRRIWMLTPAIRDYKNPAVDYAWDWNTPGGVPGDGCAPSPERSAEMLRELMSPRAPVPRPEPAAPEAAPAPADADVMAAASEQDGEPAPDLVVQADEQGVEKESENVSPQAAPPVRHRHGGALPS